MIELTHEEAARLRYSMDFLHIESSPERLWDCFETNDLDFITGLSAIGQEALARYDAMWVVVRKDDLQVAVEELATQIQTYDLSYVGYPDLLSRRDDDSAALARLQETLK